jgi:hypothetical protein
MICVLAAMLLGYALHSLLQDQKMQLTNISPSSVNERRQQQEQNVKRLQQQQDALQQQSRDKARELSLANAALKEAKQKYQTTLRQNEKLREHYAELPRLKDTISICDSIIRNAADLVNDQRAKDEAYDRMIDRQAEQLLLKDSLRKAEEGYIARSDEALQECYAAQQQLSAENTMLKKQHKRTRLRQRLFSVAGAIAGGAVVYGLLH